MHKLKGEGGGSLVGIRWVCIISQLALMQLMM